MATQRYISTSFWDDEWIQTLDPSEKLLYLYYMTNPLTNIAGVYKIAPRRISFDTGFNTETINYIMQKFEKAGKVYRFGEYVILPSWPKHQKWDKKAMIKSGIISVLQDLPQEILSKLSELGYRFDLSLIDGAIISSKIRKNISGTTEKQVYEKYNGVCSMCGGSVGLQIHHKLPLMSGGDNSFDNLELLCSTCHKKIHSPQSRYEPSYSDLDLDLDSDSDTDTDFDLLGAVAPVENPKPTPDPLYQAIFQSFIGKVGAFTNYPKEAQAIKRIIKYCEQHAPRYTNGDKVRLAESVITTFWSLTQNGSTFWRGQPFTPSALSVAGIFDRVLVEIGQSTPGGANDIPGF